MKTPVYIIDTYLTLAQKLYSGHELSQATSAFESLKKGVQSICAGKIKDVDKIQQVLEYFYTEQLFSLPPRDKTLAAFDLLQAVTSHTGTAPVMTVILSDCLRSIGLAADPVIAGQKLLLRIDMGENQYVFIEASQGQSLEWAQVEAYLGKVRKDKKIEVPQANSIVLLLLSLYKAACIDAEDYAKALAITDLLVAQEPDNPYERRDRGFLLQQLDCDAFAVEDYKFFVQKCPSDPSAQIIQLQLENINRNTQPIH
ncbi:tetratricopeptide repeat protein [Gayadomonas joobiniege]|uniref:tetratricopeptide repeat protein n=1 Tax=Gayadomonas joobiniege TaxID=1234606 RepID=UPI00036F9D20|nr:tetratricopeptide repeat protein [Gayadomonas joobiniege]